MLAIVLVLANTLRLLVLMRDEQLAVLKIIGATDCLPARALRRRRRAAVSDRGAGLAVLLLYLGLAAPGRFLPGLRFLPPSWVLVFLAGVVAVGVLGSWLTVELSSCTWSAAGRRAVAEPQGRRRLARGARGARPGPCWGSRC